MSNRYGGLIIVGVEEDRQTGKPSKCEGITDDGKQIDRVHQFANVRPLPTYDAGSALLTSLSLQFMATPPNR
jgi:hypothetical protein